MVPAKSSCLIAPIETKTTRERHQIGAGISRKKNPVIVIQNKICLCVEVIKIKLAFFNGSIRSKPREEIDIRSASMDGEGPFVFDQRPFNIQPGRDQPQSSANT